MHLVPALIPALFAFRAVRRFLFRTVSQTAVNYRGSPLSASRAGKLHGGDRLPWVSTNSEPLDGGNFKPLTSLDWQVHVYGDAGAQIRALCEQRRLALHVFGWRREMGRCGLLRDALYLVRPDGYVAVAERKDPVAALASYLDAHHLTAPG